MEYSHLTSYINIIIFSKNRAAQLDLLIRSLYKNFKIYNDLSVLYTYSDEYYKKGYDIVKKRYSEINWVLEKGFKRSLIRLIHKKYPFILILTDDCFFTKEVIYDRNLDLLYKYKNILALSLLKSEDNVYKADNDNRTTGQPAWIRKNVWNWKQEIAVPWNYCMSVSTNIYRTEDFYYYVINSNYNNPNDLEDAMVQNPVDKSLMVASDEIKVVILDVNKVSIASEPTKKFIPKIQSEESINDKWINGYEIDDNPLSDLRKDTFLFRNKVFRYRSR